MKTLLNSNIELVVESGSIYLPLLFDPDIEKEIQALHENGSRDTSFRPKASAPIVKIQGKYFIKTLNLASLISNYETLDKDSYEQLKAVCIRKYHLNPEIGSITVDGKIRTILFQVMPYFIKKNKGLTRKRFGDEEILDLIGEKIEIPKSYHEAARAFLDSHALEEMLTAIENQAVQMPSPRNGLQSADELQQWVVKALDVKILEHEYERLKHALAIRKQFSNTSEKHAAMLLYIADTGALEIDDFGFTRIHSNDEYLIYKHTGEYVLNDYYARRYLFPDCRVAVSTYGPFMPIVMEKYKHPFLLYHRSGQEICMQNFYPPTEFTPENIIKVLDEGITALLYGYDGRRRNGYHSLGKTTHMVETIEFGEYII